MKQKISVRDRKYFELIVASEKLNVHRNVGRNSKKSWNEIKLLKLMLKEYVTKLAAKIKVSSNKQQNKTKF